MVTIHSNTWWLAEGSPTNVLWIQLNGHPCQYIHLSQSNCCIQPPLNTNHNQSQFPYQQQDKMNIQMPAQNSHTRSLRETRPLLYNIHLTARKEQHIKVLVKRQYLICRLQMFTLIIAAFNKRMQVLEEAFRQLQMISCQDAKTHKAAHLSRYSIW